MIWFLFLLASATAGAVMGFMAAMWIVSGRIHDLEEANAFLYDRLEQERERNQWINPD